MQQNIFIRETLDRILLRLGTSWERARSQLGTSSFSNWLKIRPLGFLQKRIYLPRSKETLNWSHRHTIPQVPNQLNFLLYFIFILSLPRRYAITISTTTTTTTTTMTCRFYYITSRVSTVVANAEQELPSIRLKAPSSLQCLQ